MQLEFYKYQGTGNDFIIFDNRKKNLRTDMRTFYSAICDRRFGIGADGVMLLQDAPGYDFEMIYFNADGKPGSLCGNGSRCIIKFAIEMGVKKEEYFFLASDGLHEARVDDNLVKIKMKDIETVDQHLNFYEIDTGSPHYIEFVSKVDAIDVKREGARIRYSEKYAEIGINVNFVEEAGEGISMRTYERGVEDETYSCGTGVTAAAIIYTAYKKSLPGKYIVPVKVFGGNLQVSFEKVNDGHFKNIWLIGPAEFVFSGKIETDDFFT